ncbi:MAG: PaaI family thioesterase [Planctomycetaceae bacterium]
MSQTNDSEKASEQSILIRRQVPLLDHLCIRPVKSGNGQAEFEITVDDPHLRSLGILHGGVVATLLDTAMGVSANSVAPADHHVVTIQLGVNFIRTAEKGDSLIATGEVLHKGRKTIVTRGEVRNAGNELVALGTATFMVLPLPTPKA